ncbi:MAG: hypothetical protein WD928_08170 [Gammaproteobacteria bacterium]
MISLLKSTFSEAAMRVLLVGGERAILYLFEEGQLAQAYIFTADEIGFAAFRRALGDLAPAPLCVLVDVVEEEYRQETIPHVGGADRRAVIERKYARLFRGTPYRTALFQGRETDERRDDRLLLTAITRPELLTPWLEALIEHKVPVVGIYSLPILSQRLLKRIGATAPNVLLISLHKASGLRQTFFRDGHIKISRLAHMPRLGSVPFAAHLMGELEKLRRYLNSLAFVAQDSPLNIYILSHGELLGELEQHCQDSDDEKFFLVDVDDAARSLGLKSAGDSHYADVIFTRLLLDGPPPQSYAQAEETQFYALHRMRIGLSIAGLVLLLASAGWSGFNFIEGVIFKEQALDAEQKAAFYRERFEMARSKLPATPVEPRAIESAVDIIETLHRHRSTPAPLLALLSQVLDARPAIRLQQISWRSSMSPPEAVSGQQPPGSGLAPQGERAAAPLHYQIAELDARLTPFDGDYRRAIEAIDDFTAALVARPGVTAVEVLQYPLDVRSSASVSGSTSELRDRLNATFKLKLTVGVRDGSQEG